MSILTAILPAPPRHAGDSERVRRSCSEGKNVCIHEADTQVRPIYEQFIAQRFAEVYAARITHFMPRLFGLHEVGGRLIAAFGLREAACEALFLERYLDQPVQLLATARAGQRIARERIVEIGNLAGSTPGALRQLIPALTRMLYQCGYHWVVFTGSARLVNGFTRLDLPVQVLAPAPVERLPVDERAAWGSYYDHQPSVMLGDILGGYRRLERLGRVSADLDASLAPVAVVGAP